MLLLAPAILFAQTVDFSKGLIQCEGALTAEEKANRSVTECDFNALLAQIQYLINWMFAIAIPISIGIFAYAGILFMSGNEKNITKAKGIFSKVVWGFLIMCVAWLIINTILTAIVKPNQGFDLLLK